MTWKDKEVRRLGSLARSAAASRRMHGAEYPIELYIVGDDRRKEGRERFLYILKQVQRKEGLFSVGLSIYPNEEEYRLRLRNLEVLKEGSEGLEGPLLSGLAFFAEQGVEISPVGIGREGWTKGLYYTYEAKLSDAQRLTDEAKKEHGFDAALEKMAGGMEAFEYALVLEERHLANSLKHMSLFGNGLPSVVLAPEYANLHTISTGVGRNSPTMVISQVDGSIDRRPFVMDVRKSIEELRAGVAPRQRFEEAVARLLIFERMNLDLDAMKRNLTAYGSEALERWLNTMRRADLIRARQLFEETRDK